MRYLSVCSGIESATVAWHPLGWSPVAFAEYEKFPSAVLAHHYPTVPNWGDITKFKEWPDASIDVLVGGTPCQSFSVAGLREGLADPRGNLCLTFLAIADKYRPEWILFENVPGILSSDGGRDFGAFLGGLGQLGYGWSYRVLDAQYVRVDGFGRAVPQRRRRVFVVGNLRDWRRAAAVLFERESLQGNTPPRREAWQGSSCGIEFGPSGSRFTDVAPTLDARAKDGPIRNQLAPAALTIPARSLCLNGGGGMGRIDAESETLIPVNRCFFEDALATAHTSRADGFDASEDGSGRGTPLVPIAFAENSRGELRLQGGDGAISPQLTTGGGKPGQGQSCIAIQERAICENVAAGPDGIGVRDDGTAYTLEARAIPQAVAFDMRGRQGGSQFEGPHDTANIRAASGGSSRSYVAQTWAVRRLTPKECERLQGFPDGYTDVPWRNKNWTPDGPRYKSLGNSMAVNAMRWLGTRIQMVSEIAERGA